MQDFNKVYEDNYKIVLSFVAQRLNNFELAEEITNDVFIKLSKCLDSFDETKASIRTWVMTFAKNAVIDEYRRRKLETISLNKDIDNADSKSTSLADRLKCDSQTPMEVLNSKEKLQAIDNAIDGLSKTDFEIAYYFFKEELSYQEISKVMNISLGTVKGKISRARKALQSKLVHV
jgi:RNA polymerase sigma-70 factor (ECF subfamily)